MILAQPAPTPRTPPTRRTPLEDLADAIHGAQDELARVEAMLSHPKREPARGERTPT